MLIVDDESIIREGLRKHLRWSDLGPEVISAADSAQAALECAEQNAPDIFVTDICMRGKDGLDLVEDLLEWGISPQVILISSYNDFSYAQRAVSSAFASLPESIPVSMYRTFLQALRMKGYDRYHLLQHIKAGHTQEVMDIWNAAEEIMLNPDISFSVIKRFCSGFVVSLISDGILDKEDSLQDGPADCDLAKYDPVKYLENCTDKSDMTACVSRLIRQKSEAISQRSHFVRSKLIETGLQIIEKEYCNPDFNLTVLAAMLNVAPNYLSSRFKEELGVGFMKYRLEKQMEKAKLLLSNPIYKIYSISSMVGFVDEKYFSKQFKRYTGDTPKDYRNNRAS